MTAGEFLGVWANVCDDRSCHAAPAFMLAVLMPGRVRLTLSCGAHELKRRGMLHREAAAAYGASLPVVVFARRVRVGEVVLVSDIRSWIAGELVRRADVHYLGSFELGGE